MAVAQALANLAKVAMKNGKNVVKIIEVAGTVVAAANVLMDQAKPLADNIDVNAMANKMKAGADGVAKNAGKAGEVVADAANDAASKTGALMAKIGDARDEFIEGLAQARSEKDLKKTIQEARQSVLENSTMTITVSDLNKAKEKADTAGIGPINTMPGCFIIATYKKLDFDKDLTDYVSLYIGQADNVAEGVDKAISRDGDPDVYADVKYKQNVHVYIYNCLPEEIDGLYESLEQAFSDVAD